MNDASEAYDLILSSEEPPTRAELRDVVARILEQHWQRWDYAIERVHAFADDLELSRWYAAGRFVRREARRLS